MRSLVACAAILALCPALARERGTAPEAARYDAAIERLSHAHAVPERLIRRIIMRESRYAPHLTNRGFLGLMQIRLETARGMGYRGSASGLLDGETNLTYAVPYLANAYVAADRNEDRAVQLYAGGYYYVAKRKGLLPKLRTARSAPVSAEPAVAYAAPPAPPQAQAPGPFAFLFGNPAASQPAQPAAQAAAADEPAVEDTVMQKTTITSAPLPPRRPRGL